MNGPLPPRRKQGLTAIDAALALIAILLVVQMWLLTATLESYLAGHQGVALPAAVISGLLFLICAGFYLFVRRIDLESRADNGEADRAGNAQEARHATDETKTE